MEQRRTSQSEPTSPAMRVLILSFLFVKVWSQSGDVCNLSGSQGVCTPIRQCQSALDQLKQQIRPQTCGFEGRDPIVCCPRSKAVEKCKEYGVAVKGLVLYSVVGGTNSVLKEFPHMAALGFGDPSNIKYQCGGSLISDRHVLTAAHCLRSPELGPVRYVRLGDVALDGTSGTHQDYTVVSTTAHPEYRPPVNYNDIAILKLNQSVKYTPYIKPSCLHTSPSLPSPIHATGWGLLQFGGEGTNILQKVSLDSFSNQECTKAYPANKRRLPNSILDDRQICFGGKTEEKDTCQGDSGGPLQIYRPDEGLHGIVGVTSFGKSCGVSNVPGVYSRVSYYVPWIESVVWK